MNKKEGIWIRKITKKVEKNKERKEKNKDEKERRNIRK